MDTIDIRQFLSEGIVNNILIGASSKDATRHLGKASDIEYVQASTTILMNDAFIWQENNWKVVRIEIRAFYVKHLLKWGPQSIPAEISIQAFLSLLRNDGINWRYHDYLNDEHQAGIQTEMGTVATVDLEKGGLKRLFIEK